VTDIIDTAPAQDKPWYITIYIYRERERARLG
jgi:hypothetical protein